MGIRGSKVERCRTCALHLNDCLCAELPSFAPSTRVVLYVHSLEQARPSNTGRLLCRMLASCEQVVHGRGQPSAPAKLPAAPPPLVLHPDGRLLEPEDGASARCLLVPDGTWAQARRMLHRIEALRDHELVRLPPRPPTPWWLRREPHADHVCTLEAVARAIGLLESSAIEHGLLTVLREVVARTRRRRHQRTGQLIDTPAVQDRP